MASLSAVYSMIRYVRSKEEIPAALFRDPADKRPTENRRDTNVRPEPVARQLTARFVRERPLDEEPELVSGTPEAIVWASLRVDDRHQQNQPLVCLCDGQPSLRETIDLILKPGPAAEKVEILDLLPACQYVWDVAKVFHQHRQQQEAFARERMDRLLSGAVAGVVRGVRRMATERKLSGEKLKTINTVYGYLTNNVARMKYDEYLQVGYPIATGVIEGACHYLIKDRMQRNGMRWTCRELKPCCTSAVSIIRTTKPMFTSTEFTTNRNRSSQLLSDKTMQIADHTQHTVRQPAHNSVSWACLQGIIVKHHAGQTHSSVAFPELSSNLICFERSQLPETGFNELEELLCCVPPEPCVTFLPVRTPVVGV